MAKLTVSRSKPGPYIDDSMDFLAVPEGDRSRTTYIFHINAIYEWHLLSTILKDQLLSNPSSLAQSFVILGVG
jgi:hypothetical protein